MTRSRADEGGAGTDGFSPLPSPGVPEDLPATGWSRNSCFRSPQEHDTARPLWVDRRFVGFAGPSAAWCARLVAAHDRATVSKGTAEEDCSLVYWRRFVVGGSLRSSGMITIRRRCTGERAGRRSTKFAIHHSHVEGTVANRIRRVLALAELAETVMPTFSNIRSRVPHRVAS